MKNFEQIFFDLDGTIFDFYKCEVAALNKAFNDIYIRFDNVILDRYLDINAQLWAQHELGEITQEDLLCYRFEMLFKEFGITFSPQLFSDEYQKHLSNMSFFEKNALSVIKKLYKNYNLYIMTNGKKTTQTSRIGNAGIGGYFKDIFISEEIGYHKPQIEFFEKCFLKTGLEKKRNALIVGDSLSSDIYGGNNAGICTCWYNSKQQENEKKIYYDYEIISLTQLLDFL